MGNMLNADNISAIDLEPNKIYEYFYEGKVKVGAPSQELPASELKITSRVKITGDTAPNFFVQVRVGANEVEKSATCVCLYSCILTAL